MKLELVTIILTAAVAFAKAENHDYNFDFPMEGIKHMERTLLNNPGKYKTPQEDLLKGRRLLPNGGLEVSQPLLASYFGGEPGFYHGVASGDPTPSAVIIWTRYTPISASDTVTLEFRIAVNDPSVPAANLLDPASNPSVRRGTVVVQGSSDWIAKIDITGLAKNTHYVYVFTDGLRVSDIGQTRTIPGASDSASDLRYAFFSCTHMNNGYFHSYDLASTVKDLDFWSHIGDYFYEYGTYYPFSTDAADRTPLIMPTWETVSLQDYRLRQASYLHNDEGHRNLRRRVPFWGTWDDHDATNNCWGNSTAAGAENHQTICPVGPNASNADKAKYECDQDEGSATVRFTNAYIAYLEWVPHRWQPGTMGVITLGNINQVMEWGDLATLVGVDTRHSYRSEQPTVYSDVIGPFVPFATQYPNVSAYTDPNSVEYATLQQLVATQKAISADPQFHEVGDYAQYIEEAFQASKDAGKTWQIWAANTMMGPNVLPDLSTLYKQAPSPAAAGAVKVYMDTILQLSATFRAIVALSVNNLEHNRDDFGGFNYERAKLIDIFKRTANNPIVWGGDLHDSFAWVVFEGGNITGTPVTVNIGGPAVTSAGLAPLILPAFAGLFKYIGGVDGFYKLFDAAYEAHDPGLVFHDFKHKGFVVGHATKDRTYHEYFGFDPNITLTNYAAARSISGGITAPYVCLSHLETVAGQPGSLLPSSTCTDTQFDTSRPAEWTLLVPNPNAVANGKTLGDCGYKGCSFNCQTFSAAGEPLVSGGTVSRASNKAVRITYNTCATGVGSVKFTLDGKPSGVDNASPFTFTSVSPKHGAKAKGAKPSGLSLGSHKLLAEAFEGRNGGGELIERQQITFVVTN